MTNTTNSHASKIRRRQLIHERMYPVAVRPVETMGEKFSDQSIVTPNLPTQKKAGFQGDIGITISNSSGSSNSSKQVLSEVLIPITLGEHDEAGALERVFTKTPPVVNSTAKTNSNSKPTVATNKDSKLSRVNSLIENSKFPFHSRRNLKRLVRSVIMIYHKSVKFVKKLLHHPIKTIVSVYETSIFRFKQYWYAQPGELSWSYLFIIGRKNILRSFSRTAVTVGAIAAGSAAIVVLVGFAYGLESIVTKRLVQPNSLRLADVQSTSTAYQINKDAIASLSQISGVENVSMSVNLAGSVKYGDAQTEVVVVGARNDFLDASHVELVAGELFSEEAELTFAGEVLDLSQLATASAGVAGLVSGETIEAEPVAGDRISDQPVSFRINDEVYVPLRDNPTLDSRLIGYVRGSILDRYQGYRVWGGVYESVGTTGRAYQLSSGDWLGEWLKIEKGLPIYVEQAPTVYAPVVEAEGRQQMAVGFLTQNSVSLLTMEEEVTEKALDTLSQKSIRPSSFEQVLGDSTESGTLTSDNATTIESSTDASSSAPLSESNLVGVVLDRTATSSASEQQLLESMIVQSQPNLSTPSANIIVASVTKPGGKEVLVSTGFVNALKLIPEEVIGKNLVVQYILSGGLVSGMKGKVTSVATDYKIVGVFNQDEQSMIYAPLSDLESMGVNKYSLAKVLANDSTVLEGVRERVAALGFRTRSIADTLLQVNKLFSIMRFLLGSFGMIAFIVALFGMFNTLTVSLLERTREIGVMKTLGTTDRDIKRLLIVESSLIGATGGALGVLLGVVMGFSLNWISMLTRADKTLSLFQFPPLFLLFVFLLAALVGMLTGFYPARRAHKISALNALRYE